METQRLPQDPDNPLKLRVDRKTVLAWKQQARQEVAALLQDRESWYYKGLDATEHHQLALASNKHGVRGYTPFKSAARRTPYFCHSVLNLSLEDVAYALYCDTTADQRTVATHLYQERFLDAAVLDVYERQSVEDPFRFAGVKWVAYRIPPGLGNSPELLYFEYSCKTQDADGHTVLVQYEMSPELSAAQIEEQNHNTGRARAKMSQISTFQFLEEGTHCQSSGWFEASANVPVWVATKSVQQVFANMRHLGRLADARAIATLGAATSVSTSKACYLCNKKFGMMLHKRHNCRACGQSICAKCTIKLKVPSRTSSASSLSSPQRQQARQSKNLKSVLKFVEDKFCLPCVLQAREQRPESGSFSDMAGSLSSEANNAVASSSTDEGYELDLSDLHDDSTDGILSDLYDPFATTHYGQQGHSNRQSDRKLARTSTTQRLVVESSIETYLSRARDVNSNVTKKNLLRKKKRATSHPPGGINSFEWRSGPPPGPSQVPTTVAEEQIATSTCMRRESVYAQQVPAAEATRQLPAAFNKLSQSIAAQEVLL
ncbi:hypothetical protein Gpo141_00005401, partial [Globisporangium polare]